MKPSQPALFGIGVSAATYGPAFAPFAQQSLKVLVEVILRPGENCCCCCCCCCCCFCGGVYFFVVCVSSLVFMLLFLVVVVVVLMLVAVAAVVLIVLVLVSFLTLSAGCVGHTDHGRQTSFASFLATHTHTHTHTHARYD